MLGVGGIDPFCAGVNTISIPPGEYGRKAVSYTHLDVYKRQGLQGQRLPHRARVGQGGGGHASGGDRPGQHAGLL